MKKAFLNWSSGKDAAFSLFKLQQEKEISVEKLVSTVNSQTNRISMHGIRKGLLEEQAKSLGIPLHIIDLPGEVSMPDYNKIMMREIKKLVSEGFSYSVFGDIHLEDLRQYREEQLSNIGLKAIFPLWKKDTSELINDFIDAGFKAITVSVNARLLDPSFCGRIIDHAFLADLPNNVDPCGENGEFHTFVFDGPNFNFPVEFKKGKLVQKSFLPKEKEKDNCFAEKKKSWDTNFWYLDLIRK